MNRAALSIVQYYIIYAIIIFISANDQSTWPEMLVASMYQYFIHFNIFHFMQIFNIENFKCFHILVFNFPIASMIQMVNLSIASIFPHFYSFVPVFHKCFIKLSIKIISNTQSIFQSGNLFNFSLFLNSPMLSIFHHFSIINISFLQSVQFIIIFQFSIFQSSNPLKFSLFSNYQYFNPGSHLIFYYFLILQSFQFFLIFQLSIFQSGHSLSFSLLFNYQYFNPPILSNSPYFSIINNSVLKAF